MQLISIRAANGRFLARQADRRIAASAVTPDARTGFFSQSVNRPALRAPEADTVLPLRDVGTNNVWRMGFWSANSQGRVTGNRPDHATVFVNDGRRFPGIDRSTSPQILGLHITAESWFPDQEGFMQAFLVTHVEGERDLGRSTRVRLAVMLPMHQILTLPRHFFNDEWIATLRRQLGRIPKTPYRGYFLGHLSIDDSGRLIATNVPAAGAAGLFDWFPHTTRARLRAGSRRYLGVERDDQIVANVGEAMSAPPFTLSNLTRPYSQQLFHGDVVTLLAPNGAEIVNRGTDSVSVSAAAGVTPILLGIERVSGPGEILDGDRVRFSAGADFSVLRSFGDSWRDRDSRDETRPPPVLRYLAAVARPGTSDLLQIVQASDAAALDQAQFVFTVELTQPLKLFSSGSDLASNVTQPTGYTALASQCQIFIGPRPVCVPLRSYFRPEPADMLTTATEFGQDIARRGGYVFRACEGFVLSDSRPGTVPLKLYRNRDGNGGHFLAATPADGARAEALALASIEGHAVPIEAPRLAVDPLRPVPVPGSATVIGSGTAAPRRSVKALVLSGGGAKGAFEAGAVRALWNSGYRPDIIVGVSAGAINAVKLAEGTPRAADELVDLWIRNGETPNAIFHRNHYLKLMGTLGGRIKQELELTAVHSGIGFIAGGILGIIGGPPASIGSAALMGKELEEVLPGIGIGAIAPAGASGSLLGALIGGKLSLSGVDAKVLRLANMALTMLHAMHSMEPLRRKLATEIHLDRIRRSGIDLRVGITDVKGGQFFTVSGPRWNEAELADCGALELEPDHSLGQTWLSRPLYGADGYAMTIKDAVYASSALPSYMEPLALDLAETRVFRTSGGRRVARFPSAGAQVPLPAGLQRILDLTAGNPAYSPAEVENALDEVLANARDFEPITDQNLLLGSRLDSDGVRGRESRVRYLFDGGLRDTLPIRTALRLGATDITVVTGDRLQQFSRGYAVSRKLNPAIQSVLFDVVLNSAGLNGLDIFSVPLMQHLFALLAIWFNEASRTDMLLALSHNEFLMWMKKASDRLPPAERDRFRAEFEAYRARNSQAMEAALGTASALGGDPGQSPYGTPFVSEGARIAYICPDRDIVAPLDFDNGPAIREAVELGAHASRFPFVVSGA